MEHLIMQFCPTFFYGLLGSNILFSNLFLNTLTYSLFFYDDGPSFTHTHTHTHTHTELNEV